jgi:hypothetical protein
MIYHNDMNSTKKSAYLAQYIPPSISLSFCLPICPSSVHRSLHPSGHPHETPQISLAGFSCHFVLGTSIKTWRERSLVTIGRKYQAVYMMSTFMTVSCWIRCGWRNVANKGHRGNQKCHFIWIKFSDNTVPFTGQLQEIRHSQTCHRRCNIIWSKEDSICMQGN